VDGRAVAEHDVGFSVRIGRRSGCPHGPQRMRLRP
jgi:hypothetical protein